MPLQGVRILDLTIWQVGAAGVGMLADLGADVIKIEDPINGDPLRQLRGIEGEAARGLNALLEATNRNKRAMTLNLKSEDGRQVFYRMAERADVVAENFRTGVAERLGIDHATLSRHNPRIILASASGMGRQGPDAQVGLFDIMGHARSGFMHLVSGPGQPVRYMGGHGIADQTGGIMFGFGILAALAARALHGVGQHVEVSQLSALMALQTLPIQQYLMAGDIARFPDRRHVRNPLFNLYKAGDGKWLCLACLQFDRHWKDVAEILGLGHLAEDPRFADEAQRAAHGPDLVDILDRAFATRPRDRWLGLLRERDINFSPVQDYADLVRDPQVLANGYLIDVDHPRAGRYQALNAPVAFSHTKPAFRSPAPEFGQHTEAVLLEHGYDWDTIARFRDAGVI